MGLSNSQHDAIMRVYDRRQFQDKREQDERVAEVNARIPRIAELSDAVSAAMAQAARCRLNGDEAGAKRLKEEAAGLREQKAVLLRENGYPEDYLEIRYQCPDCRDKGYVDGKKCHCFRHMEIELLYDQSTIRDQLERENFDTLSMDFYDRERVDEKLGMTVYEYMSSVIGECREFVEAFGEEKGSILFTGEVGSGKTFLSNCIARELIRNCFSVVYKSATDLFELLSESRFGNRDDEEAKEKAAGILDCDMLIIDDLGTELINSFTASQLFYCVNERLNRKKGTIITTNLSLNRLRDEFTDRVASRIIGCFRIIPLRGDDVRMMKQGYRFPQE